MAAAGAAVAGASFPLPEIYHFPPFFTLQPVDATRAKQLEQWRQLIISWCQHNKQTSLSAKEWPLWENRLISRRLPDDAIASVLEHVVATGSGEWEDAGHARVTVFYRSPADWGKAIHAWATDHGMASSASIYTVYEIRTSGEWAGNEFCALEPVVLLRALEALEREGLANLVREDGVTPADEVGIKFRERR